MTGLDYRRVWNALSNPALLFDGEGCIVEANGAAEHFLMSSAKALKGQAIERSAGADSRTAALVRRVIEKGSATAEYDVELTWPDTPPRMVDLHAAPLGDGPAEGAVLVIHPRALAESMDRSLQHRSAARSVAGLSSMLAHEIKNPLAGISGAAQLLEMSLGPDDRELTGLIRDEAERIATLLHRVEQFGDFTPGRFRPVNLHDVIDRAVKSARAGFASHVRVIEDYDPSLPETLGDADQLIQIMLNLLKNAAEATPKVGGVIAIQSSYAVGMKVATGGGRRESLPLQIVISDNGKGVPEELRSMIFEPFVTSKSTGSGLGLALVSKLMTDHGGVISCESRPGWTQFRMLFPVAPAGAEETEPVLPKEAAE